MADRVHPAVQRVQTPTADPQLDRTLCEAELTQLAPADHAVLSLGEDRDRLVGAGWADLGLVVVPDAAQSIRDPRLTSDWVAFGLGVIPNPAHSVHDPILASPSKTPGQRRVPALPPAGHRSPRAPVQPGHEPVARAGGTGGRSGGRGTADTAAGRQPAGDAHRSARSKVRAPSSAAASA